MGFTGGLGWAKMVRRGVCFILIYVDHGGGGGEKARAPK